MTEFNSNPEQERAYEITRLRRICDKEFLALTDVEVEDIDKIFDDADGDLGDVISSLYTYLLQLGQDPEELMVEWGILKVGENEN